MKRRSVFLATLLTLLMAVVVSSVIAIDEDNRPLPVGEPNLIEDEGGVVLITGSLNYTNAFFTMGVAQPMVILEDQTGFVDRNYRYIIPVESQVIGQITSDFYTSPFTYSLTLPIEPRGGLRDVDNDGQQDTGVMVFAVAYWTNMFGDPFLEKRDQGGGGWSGGYASTRISPDPDMRYEVVGGKFVVFASDNAQGFPSGFGADRKLFTADDPIVTIPEGYTVVDMDTDSFTFSRPHEARIDLLESEGAALDDYSGMSYADAFDALIEKFKNEYAFTEYRNLDFDVLREKYRGRFVAADAANDTEAYQLALRDFIWEVPDGHVDLAATNPENTFLIEMFQEATAGGMGLAMRELDDGRVIVNYVTPGGPAEAAGIQLGAEIVAMDGTPITDVIDNTFIFAHVALGSPHTERLQQLRYATRRPLGEQVQITYQNPGGSEDTATVTTTPERDSFAFSSFNRGITGTELPVEFRVLDSGYGYISINSFSDNEVLTIQLWERAIQQFKAAQIPGIIIDMRNNGGGSGYLADQLAAYFFQEEGILLGQSAIYNEAFGDFYYDERSIDEMFLPPENMRYDGPVAVLIAPSCFSACEFFSYNMTTQDRAMIVGMYPTGGLGGGVQDFNMPDDITIRITIARAVDMEGNVHIEGIGVVPTVQVPVTEETLFAEGDVILVYGEQALTEAILGNLVDGGTLAMNPAPSSVTVTGVIAPETGIRYTVTFRAGSTISMYAGNEAGDLDTIINVYDGSGTQLLASNDDIDNATVSSALEDVDVGDSDVTIVVEVRLVDGEAAGQFYLRLEARPTNQQ